MDHTDDLTFSSSAFEPTSAGIRPRNHLLTARLAYHLVAVQEDRREQNDAEESARLGHDTVNKGAAKKMTASFLSQGCTHYDPDQPASNQGKFPILAGA